MKDHFLGIPFYRFYYKRPKEIFDLARRLKFNPTNTTNCIWEGVKSDGLSGSDLHKLPAFGNFFEWVQECLDEVAADAFPTGLVNRGGTSRLMVNVL